MTVSRGSGAARAARASSAACEKVGWVSATSRRYATVSRFATFWPITRSVSASFRRASASAAIGSLIWHHSWAHSRRFLVQVAIELHHVGEQRRHHWKKLPSHFAIDRNPVQLLQQR